jgi:hypothetical protein
MRERSLREQTPSTAVEPAAGPRLMAKSAVGAPNNAQIRDIS